MNSLTFYGEPSSLEFPALCPNCGRKAQRFISYSKAFCRESDLDTYVVSTVKVPFCDDCVAQHDRQFRAPGLLANLASCFGNSDMIATVFYGVAFAFVAQLAVASLLRGRWSHFGIELLIAGLFGWIAWSQGRRCWRETEYLRIAPLTEITEAFDFGDHHIGAFEADRFTCTIRNADFAREFAALNRSREWSQNSPRAENDRRQSNRKIWMFGALMLAIALILHLLGWGE